MKQPQSATSPISSLGGFFAFLASIAYVKFASPFGTNLVYATSFVMLSLSLGILLPDLLIFKVHNRASTGLNFSRSNPSFERVVVKLFGLGFILLALGLAYWAFPEYNKNFYAKYFSFIRMILVPWLVAAPFYFYYVDRYMDRPRDGYWHFSMAVVGSWEEVDKQIAGQFILSWIIKGFYLPLMFTYATGNLEWLINFDFAKLHNFSSWYDFLWNFLFFADVALVSTAYLMSLRLIDTHFRSAEPTLMGWVAALACYAPFNSLVGKHFLDYETDLAWGAWLSGHHTLYCIWGSAILVLVLIFFMCSFSFGLRFSNLSNRGIITTGPYRWSKHPSYFVKNISWWLISVPFVVQGSALESFRRCLLLLGFNMIYALRAKTEEWHLSKDPEYVKYALWMEENALLAFTRDWPVFRWFAYKRPKI